MMINVNFLPASLVISTTFKDYSGTAVGSTWWSGRYSLFPGAEIKVTPIASSIFF